MNDAINLVTKEQAMYVPTKCPCCGAELGWNGVHLQCPNIECADADVQDTLIWMKHIAPWDGLGDTLKLTYLEELLGENITIETIYERGPFSDDCIQTNYVKKTEFRKMFNALFTNQVKLCDAIQALNIPRLGDVNSEKLAKYPSLIKDLMNDSKHEFSQQERKDIGDANCNSIDLNKHKFARLKYIENNIKWESEPDTPVKGKVCITGKLSIKRDIFEKELKSFGYIATSNVSKDTFALITDDPLSSSSKNRTASQLGIQKITESQFRELYMK